MNTESTPAEQAVIDVLTGDSGCSWHHGCDIEDCYGPRARAIMAAASALIEADALDALADAATTYGPPSADCLRGIAFLARQGRTSVRDWLADGAPAHDGVRACTGCGACSACRARTKTAIIADADLIAHAPDDLAHLLALADQCQGLLDATREIHSAIEVPEGGRAGTYLACNECSDFGGDGSKGAELWPCTTAKALRATAEALERIRSGLYVASASNRNLERPLDEVDRLRAELIDPKAVARNAAIDPKQAARSEYSPYVCERRGCGHATDLCHGPVCSCGCPGVLRAEDFGLVLDPATGGLAAGSPPSVASVGRKGTASLTD